jgi:lipopolysaccharide export system ATP-binding protein
LKIPWFGNKSEKKERDAPALAEPWRLDKPQPGVRPNGASAPAQKPRARDDGQSPARPAQARTPRGNGAAPDRKPQKQDAKAALVPMPGEGILAADGLQKSYGARRVVNNVSIDVMRGEAVGILGPNGAGKTTVFYMVTGLVAADAGRIALDGHDVTGLPMYRRARLGIGYLPQEPSIFRGLNVEDNLRAVLEVVEPNRERREQTLDDLLDEFSISHLRKSPSIALSGGERRRVEIARSLASKPNYMLLDEPFAGIDPIAVGDIRALVRHLTRRGIGVLITDHNVRETLGLVDRAYIVHSGKVLMEGVPQEIVDNPDVRRLYLGEEFRL